MKSTKELPEWFKLDKYDQFTIEDQLQLIEQIENRSILLTGLADDGKLTPEAAVYWAEIKLHGATQEGGLFVRILALNGDNSEVAEQKKQIKQDEKDEKHLRDNRLKRTSSVAAVDVEWAYNMGIRAKKTLPIIDETVSHYSANYLSPIDRYGRSFDLLFGSGQEVHLIVRLDAPNTQILSELESLLPHYREALDHPEPPSIFKNKDPLKILRYKILPLIDLQIWAKIEQKNIPYSVYQAALFPFGETGENEIRKTIMPFMMRALSSGFTDEWRIAIN